jgi:glycerate kinase
MKVVFALDKFAGTLTAREACDAVAVGWLEAKRAQSGRADRLVGSPMSDGGPGFVDSLALSLRGGNGIHATVEDPLGRPVEARALLDFDGTAWVESAQACGLHLLTAEERDPEKATTRGVGQLLAAVIAARPRRVVVGVGGTATNDGGRGLLDVLASWPSGIPLEIATDVDNPLLGINGASAVFGPQKGADANAVQRLDARLGAWVDELDARELAASPGAGAGGGLGFALMRLGGRRVSGVETVIEAVGLRWELADADLVVTGEGAYDSTSLQGKVVSGVASAATEAGVPCVVVAGRVSVGRREMAAGGVDSAYSLTELAGSLEAAMAEPARWATLAGERLASQWGR